jgi:hypothetical protein
VICNVATIFRESFMVNSYLGGKKFVDHFFFNVIRDSFIVTLGY